MPNQTARPPFALKMQQGGFAAFSLIEMMFVIAIIGILAAIAISQFGNHTYAALRAVAKSKAEMLNRAVKAAEQAGADVAMTPLSGTISDESRVLWSLQMRVENMPGSPYAPLTYRPDLKGPCSDTKEFRITWTQNFGYKILEPGEVGTGFLVPATGSDSGPAFTAPAGFQPWGR
jgi:prepilin-type N-terminal cleavage/methylation domain-containing protein